MNPRLDFVAAFKAAGLSLLDRGHPRTNEYYDVVMDDVVEQLPHIVTQRQLEDIIKTSLGKHRATSFYANLYGSKHRHLPLREDLYTSTRQVEPAVVMPSEDTGLREYFEVMVELLEFSVKVSEAKSLGISDPTLD